MNEQKIKEILKKVSLGEKSVSEAVDFFKDFPYEDLGYAMVDHHRSLRSGSIETIFAEGKTIKQIIGIAEKLIIDNINVMITRANHDIYEAIKHIGENSIYYEFAKIIVLNSKKIVLTKTTVLIISAGTSDINICEEAAVTLETMGNKVDRLYDVGVAGLHRLLSNLNRINSSSVIIVVAGMDGVLPSVVAGLTDKPIIAVPTSIGYGANFGGLAPLLTMLNSCSNGVTVVNINNGYGAGYAASIINKIANSSIFHYKK